MIRYGLLLLLICLIPKLLSQSLNNLPGFILPVDIPVYLSGSFAELRTDHFHSGIDIKTQGVIGKPLYSIGRGYVSRIKVQTGGYGKSIYIQHPGGYTSVYGHLSAYNEHIDSYVKKYQYKNKTHTLDIYPAVNELSVEQGSLIGWSGNTGSSAGPHLHFEIRETASQYPMNVLKFGYDITDNVAPRISNFYIYTFEGEGKRRTIASRKKTGLTLEGNTYHLNSGDTLSTSMPVSFGLEVYDFMNGTSNRYGIYNIKMYVNQELTYHFQADRFSFAETRYINAHLDYALRKRSGEKVQLLFKKPNNRLSMYKILQNEGIILPKKNEPMEINIQIGDYSGNVRNVVFFLKKDDVNSGLASQKNKTGSFFEWDVQNSYENHLIKVMIPAGSLYEDTQFNYIRTDRDNQFHPWYHNVHNNEVPLHLPMKLSICLDGIPDDLLPKTFIAGYDEKGNPVFEGGSIKKDKWITVETRNFGQFGIEIDTISPQIIPINFRKNEDLSGLTELRFIIRDNLSNIGSYKAFIDNQWALFEYDPKNDLLTYTFDQQRIVKGREHEIEIYVEDGRGNQAVFHSGFTW